MGFLDFMVDKLLDRGNDNRMLLAYGREYGGKSRRDRPIYADRDRLTNLHGMVIGGSGSGKSRSMYHQVVCLIDEIIRGKNQSIILIDPEGDAFRSVLRYIAKQVDAGHEELAERLVIIDPTYRRDRYGSVGVNVLEVAEDQEPYEVVAELWTCFESIWGKTGGTGDRMADIFLGTQRLLQSNNLTLAEAVQVLTDEEFVRKLLPKVRDESVLLFWEGHFLKLDRRERRTWIESSRNKLNAFCNSNPYLLPIFSQARSTMSFRRVIDDGLICLVNASKNHLKGSRNLFCSLLLSKIYMALIAREREEESERVPVFIHVDELPEVYNPSSVLGMLAEGRKYGCSFTGYLQTPAQFESREMDNILGNCATQVVFWLERKGAERMAKELFGFDGKRVKYDGNWDPRYWSVQEEMEHAINELSSQKPRECYIRLQGMSDAPYIATTPEVEYPPPMPEMEERLREISASKYNRSLEEIAREREERRHAFEETVVVHQEMKPDKKTSDELSSDERLLLRDIYSRPFVLLTSHYQDLSARISKSKAGRIKGKLVKLGYVEEVPIRLGKRGGQPKLLKLTDNGCSCLGLKDPYRKMGKGGFAHIFWQNRIGSNFRHHGYKVTIEDSVGRNMADVAIEKDGKRTAIEVTLHNENAVRNMVRDLGSGYDQVWIACPDTGTLDKTKKKLAKELEDEALGGRIRFFLLTDLVRDMGV